MNRARRSWAAVAASLLVLAACSTDDGSGSESVLNTTVPEADDGGEDGAGTEAVEEAPAVFDLDAVLAADPDCPSPVVGDPLRIGYAADFSEVGGQADVPGSDAAIHLAKLVNCSGGLDGRPVEVVVEDVSGDALATRAAMARLLAQEPHVLLGPPFPDPGFRVLQVTDGEYGVVFTGSTEPALADATELAYLVAFNDTQGATVAAQFALERGWGRAVTFSAPGPYFGYNPLVFTDAYTAAGGTVLADFTYEPAPGPADFSEAVAVIAADPPDVIYAAMFAEQVVSLQEQLVAAGVEANYLLSDAYEATGGYAIELGPVNDVFHVTHAPPDGGRLEALTSSLTTAMGEPPSAPSMAALAGDAFAVIANAYLQVGTTDPRVLGLAIADLVAVDGVTGSLTYDGSGAPTKPIYIHEVVDGQGVLVATITP